MWPLSIQCCKRSHGGDCGGVSPSLFYKEDLGIFGMVLARSDTSLLSSFSTWRWHIPKSVAWQYQGVAVNPSITITGQAWRQRSRAKCITWNPPSLTLPVRAPVVLRWRWRRCYTLSRWSWWWYLVCRGFVGQRRILVLSVSHRQQPIPSWATGSSLFYKCLIFCETSG